MKNVARGQGNKVKEYVAQTQAKQDDESPECRSRFVAQEIQRSPMSELYAAIPPLEWLALIVAFLMGCVAARPGDADQMKLMICDVSRAYVFVFAVRPVYVNIVDEDYEGGVEHRCGRFNVPMHGTRGAALNCHEHFRSQFVGFLVSAREIVAVHISS